MNDDLLVRIGAAVPGLDAARMLAGRWSPEVERHLTAAAVAADRDAIAGTPAFLMGPTGGRLEPVMVGSLDAAPFRAHLDELLAR